MDITVASTKYALVSNAQKQADQEQAASGDHNGLSFAEMIKSASEGPVSVASHSAETASTSQPSKQQLVDMGLLEWGRLEREKMIEKRAMLEVMRQQGLSEDDAAKLDGKARAEFDAKVQERIEEIKKQELLANATEHQENRGEGS